MRTSLVSLLLVVACASLARPAFAISKPEMKIIGWTADQSAFVYASVLEEMSPDEWFVVSAADGKTTTIHDEKKMRTFLAAHPIPGYSLDDAAEDESKEPAIPGSPEATSDLNGEKEYRAGAVIHCAIKRGGAVLPSATFKLRLSGHPGLDWRFSPDGKRVAWLLTESECSPTGQGDFNCNDQEQVMLDRAVGPRIQLVGKDLPAQAFSKLAAALDGKGFVVAATGEAQKARDATVVFVAKGSESDAQKIAAAIPGGATVEALSWKAPFEIVVAVGASAAR